MTTIIRLKSSRAPYIRGAVQFSTNRAPVDINPDDGLLTAERLAKLHDDPLITISVVTVADDGTETVLAVLPKGGKLDAVIAALPAEAAEVLTWEEQEAQTPANQRAAKAQAKAAAKVQAEADAKAKADADAAEAQARADADAAAVQTSADADAAAGGTQAGA